VRASAEHRVADRGARALQAVGGTMLNPVALAIVAATFCDRAERAMGLLSTGRWASDTADRAATLFEGVDTGAAANTPHAPSS